jgi:hypothetical protein
MKTLPPAASTATPENVNYQAAACRHAETMAERFADLIRAYPSAQSHVTKHADHYHLSAKRPSVRNDLFGPRPAR